uniref:VM domain-containing protein n=1 Tax=Anopheles atroparvus TaxID=41427 RepID=A0A182JFS0_ANOAO
MKIGLVCLVWAAGAMAQCGQESWYGSSRVFVDEVPSVEDRVLSFEEVSNEYYPQNQDRYMRSSRYPPSYGYGNEVQQDSGDWERYSAGPTRKPPRQETPKSRRKYGTYGKSSRTRGYGYKSSPDVNMYGRKKTNRAATPYSDEGPQYGKTTSVTFKALPPKPNCAQNLLIGCTPTVTRVPCSASLPHETYGAGYPGHAPYYPQPPMYHHAPFVHYGPPHPPPYPGYHPHPAAYYPPPTVPQAYAKPTGGGGHGKGSTYKAAPEEEEQIPGFPAPVQENLGESSKVPVISAFNKPSTDAPPTVGSTGPTTAVAVVAGPAATTGNVQEKPASTPNPIALLTTTTVANEDNDEFWAVESNTESSTDAVEVATAR